MVNFNILAVTLLATGASLVSAQPVDKRAGGPAVVPIPDTCSLVSVSPANNAQPSSPYVRARSDDVATAATTFIPKAAFLSSNRVYAWFADPGTFSHNASLAYQICLEQCHGLGSGSDCQSVYFAQTYPAEPQFGGPGGWPSDACIMFKTPLTAEDLENVPTKNSTATGAIGTNIFC